MVNISYIIYKKKIYTYICLHQTNIFNTYIYKHIPTHIQVYIHYTQKVGTYVIAYMGIHAYNTHKKRIQHTYNTHSHIHTHIYRRT